MDHFPGWRGAWAVANGQSDTAGQDNFPKEHKIIDEKSRFVFYPPPITAIRIRISIHNSILIKLVTSANPITS